MYLYPLLLYNHVYRLYMRVLHFLLMLKWEIEKTKYCNKRVAGYNYASVIIWVNKILMEHLKKFISQLCTDYKMNPTKYKIYIKTALKEIPVQEESQRPV